MMSMPLLWQTLLLMTIAYLVGAALACFLRRTFFPAREIAHAPSGHRVASPPVTAPVAIPIPVPVPRAAPAVPMPPPTIVNPVPMPGSDRGAVAAAIAQAGAEPAAARTGEPFRRTDLDAPEPSPSTRPPAPEPHGRPSAPMPASPPPSPPAGHAKLDRFGEALSGPGEAGRASRDTFDSTAAAASAAAAAAAAGLAQASAAMSSGPSMPPERAVVVVPAGSRPQTPNAALPDDLQRIRAIDVDLEARLNELGVTRFDQIAAWQASDVARFSQEFDFRGRIEHENWIEQAQILARGEETFYSRRRAKEEPAPRPAVVVGSALPSPARADEDDEDGIELATLRAARKASELAAAMTPREPSKLEGALSSGTSAAIAAAAASAAAAAAAAASLPPHSRVEPPSAPPDVAARAAFATTGERTASVAPPAGRPPPSPPSTAPLATANRDQLQRIAGINAEIEKLLNVQGVARFGQIANWSRSDIDRFDRLLGHPGRVARENWIEQAQILSKGNETAYSRDFERRRSGTAVTDRPGPTLAEAPLNPRPAKLADAIQDNARSATDAERVPATRTGDLSTLRSVRSEAYRSDETGGAAPAGTASGTGEAGRPVRSSVPDDLKRIRGVGVLIEKKLNSMGTNRYEQIANWTTSDIDRVSQALDFKGRIERENWVEQARILGSGGQTEFSRRVDRGEVDSSRGRP